MELTILGYVDGQVVARSPEPARVYYSNPDWALDDAGPLLLWDTFGGEFAISLARPSGDGWTKVADFPGAMHSHLIWLPERGLKLVLGVRQTGWPRAIDLWYCEQGDSWRGPVELFGAADFHAGSTPWAVHQGRLFVPFETQQTNRWGSYEYGCVHAALDSDLRRPGSWTLVQNRVPWSVLPGAIECGGLEGNLVVAPDGELYNFLRLPAYNRLGRARWNGTGWTWLGLVQGVHNQSKPELFGGPDGRWFLLANGWPARVTANLKNAQRNTLCLWEATEPDLSRWRLARVVASDHDPRHAFSYVAGHWDPATDVLRIAERHGDDETRNFHDTNCTVVRTRPDFTAWVAEPALVPYGNAAVNDQGEWVKANAQDGLLLSHLDGALYPQTLTATVRIDALPREVGALDLLGFATCDLLSLVGLQLVDEGRGAYLALSTGGRRLPIRETVAAGEELALRITLLSPFRAEVQIGGETPVVGRTHLASDPTLAGILPRADRPTADLGRVTVTVRPALDCGTEVFAEPSLPGAVILADGRGVTGPLARDVPAPAENLVPGGPLVGGGHPAFFEPWAGGLMPGADSAALWAPLDSVPESFTMGGVARVMDPAAGWTVVLGGLGERSPACGLRRDAPYLAVLLLAEAEGVEKLALAWRSPADKLLTVASEPVGAWFTWFVTAQATAAGLVVTVYGGEPGAAAKALFTAEVPGDAVAGARHWLALAGTKGGEVRGFGGVFLAAEAYEAATIDGLSQAGYLTKMDSWPARRPTCAGTPPVAATPVAVPEPEPASLPPADVPPPADAPGH